MDESRDCNQRLQLHIPNHTVVFLADSVQRFRRFVRGKRCEQRLHMTVRIGGSDIILHTFCAARKRVIHVAVSPMGLPMLAVWGLGKLQGANAAMKNFIHS